MDLSESIVALRQAREARDELFDRLRNAEDQQEVEILLAALKRVMAKQITAQEAVTFLVESPQRGSANQLLTEQAHLLMG